MTIENKKEDNNVKEINLLYFLRIIVLHRWMIGRNLLVTVVLVALISFVLPQKYTSVVTLMPPQDQSKSTMESVLAEVAVPGLGLPTSGASSSEIMVEILKSRSVNELVLTRFFKSDNDSLPLYKLLHFSSIDKALLKINKLVRFTASKQGIISVAVTTKSRNLAADVANAYVDELDKVNRRKSVSRAKNSRIYIETQLRETEKRLVDVTKELAEFQRQHKAVSMEEQMKAAIQQAGEVKGQIIAKEVQLGVMQQTMKAGNTLVVRAQRELDELNKRYKELQYGNDPAEKGNSEFYLPFADVPEIGLQLAELTREAKVQETVWGLLNQQYYQAKIQEARDTPTVQVLDKAVPPIVRSSPKRKRLVVVFGLLSVIFSFFWVFAQEYMIQLDDRPDKKKQIDSILNEFRQDLLNIKQKLKR